MDANEADLKTLDTIAKAQLALIHEAVLRPTIPWELVQHLVQVWQISNAQRYQIAGLSSADAVASLRMIFRDYLDEMRLHDPEEADRLRQALGPELDV